MNNRRNYYRVLHVQPEAPLEVIKASYRTIMHKLEHHPDLGGSHAYASLLNEVYATLSDAARRTKYDQQLFSRYGKSALAGSKAPAQPAAQAGPTPQAKSAPQYKIYCVYCRTLNLSSAPDAVQKCGKCGHVLHQSAQKTCQRTLARVAQRGEITFFPASGGPCTGRIVDVSPRGIGFMSPYKLQLNQIIKIQSSLFQATARVVHCRPSRFMLSAEHTVGVVFINVEFAKPQGTFISVAA